MRQSRERTGAQEKVGKILCALANEGHGEYNGRRKNPLETIKGEKNMKVCPKCGSQMNDTDLFCQNCGMSFGGGAPHENSQQPNGGQQNNWQQPNN